MPFTHEPRHDHNRDRTYLGRYELVRLLATGGMSRVYQARDAQLGREVALKVLAPGLAHDPVRVERFRLEARRVAALRHPHIVPLLDYGEEGDTFYLVMPFYPHALREELRARASLPLAEATAIAAQLASALDYAHQQGLVHRDVKPENILLDEGGNALLTDFGIAKSVPSAPRNLATAGPLAAAEAGQMPIASIEYSAPEHLMGRPTDARSDVYGLAIVVYELLTGHVPLPLNGEHIYMTIMRMLTEPPTPPSLLALQPLPPMLDTVLLCALESDPRRRYASPGEFCAALAQTLARPESGDLPSFPPSPPFPSYSPNPSAPHQAVRAQPNKLKPQVTSPRTTPPAPAPPQSGPLRLLRRRK